MDQDSQPQPEGRRLFTHMLGPDAGGENAPEVVDWTARAKAQERAERRKRAELELGRGNRHRAGEVVAEADEIAEREDDRDVFEDDGTLVYTDGSEGGDPELPIIDPAPALRRRIRVATKYVMRRTEHRHTLRPHAPTTRSRGSGRPRGRTARRSRAPDDGGDDAGGDEPPASHGRWSR